MFLNLRNVIKRGEIQMSFGKMNAFIDIIETVVMKDSSGFATSTDVVIASVRAYFEERHGNKFWANRAAFSTATCLFQFRKIPTVDVKAEHIIICNNERFKIVSVENVSQRNMYIEVLAERLEATKDG
jgi:head-tail adaptor